MVEGVRRIPFTFYDGIVMQIHAAPFKIKLKSFLNFFLLPSYLCFRAKCDVMKRKPVQYARAVHPSSDRISYWSLTTKDRESQAPFEYGSPLQSQMWN